MLSHVLSPQYFIWAIPLALLLAVEVMSDSIVSRLVLFGMLVVVVASTTWMFPYHYIAGPGDPYALVSIPLEPPHSVPPSAAIVLIARNFTYLGMMIWLVVALLRTFKKREYET